LTPTEGVLNNSLTQKEQNMDSEQVEQVELDADETEEMELEDDGQPTEYEEWQDFYGGDDWDNGQYDNDCDCMYDC
jgi:hypothetical protein